MRDEKDGVIRQEGVEKDKRNCNLLCSTTKMFIKIDVPITRKTSKAQNALLADLLSRHAAC